MAVLLKAVVEEYQDISIEDIINKYLVDVSDQNNPIIKALDKEFGGFSELTNQLDLLFLAKISSGQYDLLVDVEFYTSKNRLSIVFKQRVYIVFLLLNKSGLNRSDLL